MKTLTRKERELKEREEKILSAAHTLLRKNGYLGLSMDRVAEAVEFSKGTIYNHFDCKEEIILALAIRTLDKRTDLFDRAALFAGCPRERITALGFAAELFVRLYPGYFEVEQILRSASIWEKTSPQRRKQMEGCEMRCMHIVAGLIRDGVAQGDLTLSESLSAEELVFGLWSLTFGGYSIAATSQTLPSLGVEDPYVAIIRNGLTLLDGLGWKPLSTELDYQSVLAKVATTIFLEECKQAKWMKWISPTAKTTTETL